MEASRIKTDTNHPSITEKLTNVKLKAEKAGHAEPKAATTRARFKSHRDSKVFHWSAIAMLATICMAL
jgi:hypothetical protein